MKSILQEHLKRLQGSHLLSIGIVSFKKVLFLSASVIGIGFLLVLLTNLFIYFSVKDDIYDIDEYALTDYDAIVVLGAGIHEDGSPSWMLEDRLIIGNKAYKKNAAPKIIMSGDHGTEDYDEVNNMKNYAINKGIPSEDIFMDHAGFSTYESMYRAKEIFGAQKIVIVSQGYHLYRSLYIAKALGLEVTGIDASLRNYSKMQYYREFREILARTKDFFKVIVKPEPTYLGETIDLNCSGDVTNDK